METQILSSADFNWLIFGFSGAIALLMWLAYRNTAMMKQLQQKLTNLNIEIKKINHNLSLLQNGAGSMRENDEEDIDETKLYIGNIDYAASETELAAHFAKFGQIETVNIPVDRYTGKARGFGFITFKKVSDAMKAMNLDGSEFKGRQIQVNFARERASA